MPVTDSPKLISLREKLEKNVDENGKLKEQIAKEEKRLKDKEKRENEKWWRDLAKGMETLLITLYGQDYKEEIPKDAILDILKEHLPGKDDGQQFEEINSSEGDTWQ